MVNKVTNLYECYHCGFKFDVEDGELVPIEEMDLVDLANDRNYDNKLENGFKMLYGIEE